VSGQQGRVEVDDDREGRRSPGPGGLVAGQFPGPGPRRGARGGDRFDRATRIGAEFRQQPGDHRVGGDRPIDAGLRADQGEVREAVPAQRDRDGQVRDDLAWAVAGQGLAPRLEGLGQGQVEADSPGGGGQQRAAGLSHGPRGGRVSDGDGIEASSLGHLESAPSSCAD
jgi:hypothetical protein